MKMIKHLYFIAFLATALGCSENQDPIPVSDNQSLTNKLLSSDYMYTLTLEELMQIDVRDLASDFK